MLVDQLTEISVPRHPLEATRWPSTIENPILNGPCDAPTRHFRFDAAGITSEIVESRRPSAYFMPIARPKKKSAQKSLETEWTLDRIKETTEVQRTDEKLKVFEVSPVPTPPAEEQPGETG